MFLECDYELRRLSLVILSCEIAMPDIEVLWIIQ